MLLCPAPAAVAAPPDARPPDASAPVPGKRAPGFAERERALKAEEERLLALRKEVEEKIAKYEKLLGQLQEKEKRKQDETNAKVDQLVKLFEGMPPDGAAARMAALDDEMAAAILVRMKTRKASAVLTLIEPKRVALIARKMAGGVKNFPPE
jgi:flagellar motility protein MotE (MotC chaperone)